MSGIKRHCDKETCAYIVFVNPQNQKMKSLEISSNKSEFVIGRGISCDIVINNPVVSRKHCVVTNDENGGWILCDKSSSGVFVNKERVPFGASHTLCDGDTITITSAFNYPFHFYTSEPSQKKKKKLFTDILSDTNKRNKEIKEINLKMTSSSILSVSSDEDNKNSCIVNGSSDSCSRVKEVSSAEKEISSLRLKLEKLADEKIKLEERINKSTECYSKQIKDLKLEIEVGEFRNALTNETIENLRGELESMKAKLCVAEQNQVKEEVVKNGVMLKVNEDIMELLENELQCSICNEIIIEATVLNCTHMFCHVCISTWMKKKKECAVCRTRVKDVVKSRLLDSFVEKILQKFSSPEISEHRKQLIEDRNKEKIGKTNRPRQVRNNRLGREAEGYNQIQDPIYINMALPPPANLVRRRNMVGAYFPEMEHLPGDIVDDLNEITNEIIANNELMNELFPIINLTNDNDAIDLRINRRVRRTRRGQPVRFHAREVVIDLRDSPERD